MQKETETETDEQTNRQTDRQTDTVHGLQSVHLDEVFSKYPTFAAFDLEIELGKTLVTGCVYTL